MRKSEVAEKFSEICGVKFPFFSNRFKLSHDANKIDERRKTLSFAKDNFMEWQKRYENYLMTDEGNGTQRNVNDDKASHLINAYNNAKTKNDKAVIISILNQWFNSLLIARQTLWKRKKKYCREKLWKEYNDGRWINEDVANMLNECFESIRYYREYQT